MKRILLAGDCTPGGIGIRPTYLRAIREVGAVAAIAYAQDVADAEALAGAFDAMVMPGGGDLPSRHFGQAPHVSCLYDDPMRDVSDKYLLEAFRATGKRVLGICRGCQVSNVFLGGTLHQHLPDAYDPVLWHSGNITGRHKATVAPDTLLAALIGAGETQINSSHHQAIDIPGQGLSVSAVAPDGVIEAVEGENLLLVQWHPEQMPDTMRPLFEWVAGER